VETENGSPLKARKFEMTAPILHTLVKCKPYTLTTTTTIDMSVKPRTNDMSVKPRITNFPRDGQRNAVYLEQNQLWNWWK